MTGRIEEPADKAQRAVQSVEVGGRLLLALASQPAPMTLKDLAQAADLSPSRAHPYLVSFGKLRLIEQDTVTGRYALGAAALQIGLACLHQLDTVKLAGPVADTLAAQSGHAVALAVWGDFGPTIIRMIEARQPLHVTMKVGSVMSIFGTATGRAFAAVMPAQQLEQADSPLDAQGERPAGRNLKRRAAELAEIVAEFRLHGVARAASRPIPGVNAFSAIAFDHEGKPAIAITALGHQDTFPSAWSSPAAQGVRDAAREISLRLGWSSDHQPPATAR